MSFVLRFVFPYARFFGGETGPAGLVEQNYLRRHVQPGSVVVDIGGGDGKLANRIAETAGLVAILDREATSLEGADKSVYAGSLTRALRDRRYGHVIPIQGNAASLPFRDRSVDVIVSSQLLEHLDGPDKEHFFDECARCLKDHGILAISTPNADVIEGHDFWLSRLARTLIPRGLLPRLPVSMRGPWLEQTVQEWEARVGHYDHGCRMADLLRYSAVGGLEEIDRRCTHTRLTFFWLELAFTFPLLAMLAAPVVRLAYALEERAGPREGINLLVTFQRPGPISIRPSPPRVEGTAP